MISSNVLVSLRRFSKRYYIVVLFAAVIISILIAFLVTSSGSPVIESALTPYSSISMEDGKTVFNLSSQGSFIYKSKNKKGLDAALEFLQVNPSIPGGKQLFPPDFSKSAINTREEKDADDAYLIKNEIPLTNEHYFFDQTIKGVPVYGAKVIVHIKNDSEIYSTNGSIVTGSVSSKQKISEEEATQIALRKATQDGGGEELIVSNKQKYYLNEELLGLSKNTDSHLVLMVLIRSSGTPVLFNTQYFVDLEDGKVLYTESQTRDALQRNIYNCQGGSSCTLVRQEGAPAKGDADVDNAYDYFNTTYNYYFNTFGRNSYDASGGPFNGYVHAPTGFTIHKATLKCPNAFWNGYEMVFCSGIVTLDITGHELTHAVTNYTANLIYSHESGALNEAVSDIFGSALDNNWTLGESVAPGAGLPIPLRSMSNPPSRNQPDKLSAYVCKSIADDVGGVHSNSGIINKAFFLMTDGGTFNGCTINGLGRAKSHPIVYQALTKFLTPTSNFKEAYTTFLQACADLYGDTSSECKNTAMALQAVEIDQQAQGNPQAPKCSGGTLQAPTCVGAPSTSPIPTVSITNTPTPTLLPGQPTYTPTPTPSSTPTPTPVSSANPTATPTPGGGFEPQGTPTPTPDQFYTCGPDPKCIKSGKSIQLCPLVCTPI